MKRAPATTLFPTSLTALRRCTTFLTAAIPSLRNGVQLAILVITLALGVQFAVYVHQLAAGSPITVPRPPGVEGFLPIGALMGWKLFISTGVWDPIHPAAMVIFGFALLSALSLRKSFCSWICPVGTVAEWIARIPRPLKLVKWHPPRGVDFILRGCKYLLLSFFLYVILTMPVPAILQFLHSPYYQMSDVKMLYFFLHMTGLTAGVLAGLAAASWLIPFAWCRYLCPYGALLGLLAMFSPTRIQRNSDACVNCGRCSRACPSRLPVAEKRTIRSPECWGCLQCTAACPEKEALALVTVTPAAPIPWTAPRLAITLVLSLALAIYSAQITGHWHSGVTIDQARQLIQSIDAPHMSHPTF